MAARPSPPPRAAELAATAVALALHVGLLAVGLVMPERAQSLLAGGGDEADTWLEIEELRPGSPAAAAPPASEPAPAPESGPAAATRPAPAAVPVPVPAAVPAPAAEPAPAEAAPEPAAEAAAEAAPEPAAAPAAEAAPAAPAVAEAPAPAPAPEPSPGPAPGPAPGSPDEYGGAPPPEPGIAPGLGGTPVWTLPGVLAPPPAAPAAPTTAPAAPDVDLSVADKVLDSTLQSRDKQLGLQMPAAGVVTTAVIDAVRTSEAPLDARAKFEVKLGRDGRVQGVRVLSTTAGDAGAWDRAAQRAASALASRQLQMGEAGRDGATVIVKVESKVAYPSGAKEKMIPEPVCAEEVLLEMIQNMEQLSGQKVPPRIQLPDGSFCIPVGIRARGDLSDFGAHQQRVVSASFDVQLPGAMKLQAEEVLPVDTRAPWLKNLPAKGPRLPPPKKWEKKKKKKKKP